MALKKVGVWRKIPPKGPKYDPLGFWKKLLDDIKEMKPAKATKV